jgi:predicted MFS family arabinose efflux permease
LFVGGMTVLASVGAVLGSVWAARREDRLEAMPALSAGGLLAALACLAALLAMRAFLLAATPIFVAGVCMGVASVSIYACIVKASSPDQFLSRSILYLLGMQIGNALGVQAVGVAEMLHFDVVRTACALAALPVRRAVGRAPREERAGCAASCKPAASRPKGRQRARSSRDADVDELRCEIPARDGG